MRGQDKKIGEKFPLARLLLASLATIIMAMAMPMATFADDGSNPTGSGADSNVAASAVADALNDAGLLAAEFTVRFNSFGGTPVPDQRVPSGGRVTEPPAPVYEGMYFDGWFTTAGATERWDFSRPVTADLTLYAHWLSDGSDAPTRPVWRLHNPYTGEHILTRDRDEYRGLCVAGWSGEGQVFSLPPEGVDIYRLYNPYNSDHHYTTDFGEYEALQRGGWQGEGVKFHGMAETDAGARPVYRLHNTMQTANGGLGSHLWTMDRNEYETLPGISGGAWVQEGIAFYGCGDLVPDSMTVSVIEIFACEGEEGDSSAPRVPDFDYVVRNASGGVVRSGTSSSKEVVALVLPRGDYRIEVTKPGYTTAVYETFVSGDGRNWYTPIYIQRL